MEMKRLLKFKADVSEWEIDLDEAKSVLDRAIRKSLSRAIPDWFDSEPPRLTLLRPGEIGLSLTAIGSEIGEYEWRTTISALVADDLVMPDFPDEPINRPRLEAWAAALRSAVSEIENRLTKG